MEVIALLADAATYDQGGRIAAIGLGWEITGPSPLPGFDLMVQVKTPIDWGQKPYEVLVQLIDSDGHVEKIGAEEEPFEFRQTVTPSSSAARPDDLKGGVTLLMRFPPGIVLSPGRHVFTISIDGETRPTWQRDFHVRSKPDEYPATVNLLTLRPSP